MEAGRESSQLKCTAQAGRLPRLFRLSVSLVSRGQFAERNAASWRKPLDASEGFGLLRRGTAGAHGSHGRSFDGNIVGRWRDGHRVPSRRRRRRFIHKFARNGGPSEDGRRSKRHDGFFSQARKLGTKHARIPLKIHGNRSILLAARRADAVQTLLRGLDLVLWRDRRASGLAESRWGGAGTFRLRLLRLLRSCLFLLVGRRIRPRKCASMHLACSIDLLLGILFEHAVRWSALESPGGP